MDDKGPDTQVHTVVTWSRALYRDSKLHVVFLLSLSRSRTSHTITHTHNVSAGRGHVHLCTQAAQGTRVVALARAPTLLSPTPSLITCIPLLLHRGTRCLLRRSFVTITLDVCWARGYLPVARCCQWALPAVHCHAGRSFSPVTLCFASYLSAMTVNLPALPVLLTTTSHQPLR